MQKSRRQKLLLEAVVVIAVALSLVMPFSAANTSDTPVDKAGYSKMEITNILDQKEVNTRTFGDDILVTPYSGDDRLPSLTVDQFSNVVVTWTNEQSFTETNWGIAYSNTPTDQDSWLNEDNNVVLMLQDPNSMFFDTAFINTNEYTGLWGVYLAMSNEQTGFYKIPDVTVGYQNWQEIYVWTGEAAAPLMAEIVDSDYLYAGINYPDLVGPWNFYVYNFVGMGYDITDCPVFFRTDFDLDGGGISYFDAQENEDTAPADNCDYVNINSNEVHMVLQNTETDKIIWKKLLMDEEPDIEYTPYQDTIADGVEPSITGNSNVIAIVYENGGQIICSRSTDEGETWETSTVGTGEYPDITMIDNTLWAAYIDGGNLYKVSSEDNGATWGEAVQVNDVDGTVVDESKSIDIHEGGIVWVDERGEDWDIYYDVLSEEPKPVLQIKDIAGGVGVSAVIENIGDADATNVEWTITLDGTVFLGGETTGTIATIAQGDTAAISSGFPLGFGAIDISISATSDEGASASESAQGNLLLFFVTGL